MDDQDPTSIFPDTVLDITVPGEEDGGVTATSSIPPPSSSVSGGDDAFFDELESLEDKGYTTYFRGGLEFLLGEFSIPNVVEPVLEVGVEEGGGTNRVEPSDSSRGRRRRKQRQKKCVQSTTKERREKKGGKLRCQHCQTESTPLWRIGPLGPKTLCNACGVRFSSGRLVPEYRPANSPTFCEGIHSNSHGKIVEMRRVGEQRKRAKEDEVVAS